MPNSGLCVGTEIFLSFQALFADIMGLILAKKRNEEGRKKIGTTHKPLLGILSNVFVRKINLVN